VSLYLDKRVQRVIKEIALAYDRKPHDLYIEAINMMLRSYGKGTVADTAQGRRVSPNPSTIWAPAVFEAMPEAGGLKRKAFAASMERHLSANRIKVEITGSASKQRERIVRA
jgi:hypothetical protein